MKRALISGVTGQDGSYLAELLLAKGYEVHGVIRRSSSLNTGRIDHLYQDPHEPGARLRLHYGDLTDGLNIHQLVARIQPDEVFNLAAQSHVRLSFDMPVYTAEVAALGTIRLLEAVRDLEKPVRFYQASTSEMFGNAPAPQNEHTPLRPRSPYAAAKAHAFWSVVNAREAGMFACNGILFNHESPRRGETFVTRKITRAAGRIKEGLQNKLYLGNLDAKRDWGFARDYVWAMWRMLQTAPGGGDYVVATGEYHSVREFAQAAFAAVGLDWQRYVEIDRRYFRPTEVNILCGDASKARVCLGWEPTVGFEDLVSMMVQSDWDLAKGERLIRDCGNGPQN